jgi:eukaryotic-like serine/threonine-protein kinase
MDARPSVNYASAVRTASHWREPMSCLREPDVEPIPGYKLIEPLGSGGFGEVWKCEAPGGILKAIKFVFGNLNSLDEDSVKAEQEAKALERVKLIRHPFILSMDLIKVVNGELLIVMELADRSLHDLFEDCTAQGQVGVPRETLLGMLADAADGLDHMIERHELQHLDVKPKNLFLIADRVKVADFGLVRGVAATASSAGLGGGITPVYAAPETFAGKVSKHSDQYSLAVVYVELLTGQKPFDGRNIRQLAMQHMMEPPKLTAVPEFDRPVLLRALAKNPDERFPTCLAFVRALISATQDGNAAAATPLGSRALDLAMRTPLPQPRTSENGSNLLLVTPAASKPLPARPMAPPVTRRATMKYPGGEKQSLSASLRFESDARVLRPAILIGIGSFGRRALQQVRCRLLDRVGQLSQVPCIRYLYIDPDPDAAEKASSSSSDVALSADQLLHTPLQQVTNYRRRQLDHLLEWLPRDKLYAIPRSLRVDGSRALGRLAFCDHYLRFMNRMKHEIGVCTNAEALHQSSTVTGLPIRTKEPAVYLFVSASGGTSGMILDIGHAVRRSLEKMNLPNATINAFLLAGSPNDPGSPTEELANVFATLTELNHYADPDVPFVARYGGPEGPQMEARGLPFTTTYLLPMAQRTSESFRDTTSHLAGYVTYDLTTPLGSGLDALRATPPQPGRTPFRGFGTFGVWYPRGLLLRSAARQTCIDLIREWISTPVALPPQAEKALSDIMSDTRLAPDALKKYIVECASTTEEGRPLDSLAAWVQDLNKRADAVGKIQDPESWAVGIWDTARDWMGLEPTVESDSPFRRGRLSKALDFGLKRAYDAWNDKITAELKALEQMPGPRLGSMHAVLEQLRTTAAGAIASTENQLEQILVKRETAKVQVQEALQAVQTGGSFSLFGGRISKAIRTLADRVRSFVDLRVAEDLAANSAQFYRRLYTRFEDLQRDIKTARDRLSTLSELLEVPIMLGGGGGSTQTSGELVEEATQTTLRGSNTMRIVLPKGQDHLDRSAADLLEAMPRESLASLEAMLTTVVLEPKGGLTALCVGTNDLSAQLANPLIDQSTVYLATLLPSEDVTAVEHSASRGDANELGRRISSYIRGAAPLTGGPMEDERTFLVHPDTEPGRAYAEVVRQVLPAVKTVTVKGAGTDLMFCREQSSLRTADLFRLLDPCWDAYHQTTANVLSNPHSRYDVPEWLPLVE